jgi:hypothetical protein
MNENSQNHNLNESDILEFALRLVTYPNDSRTQNAKLIQGQLPDKLPEEIPIPEGSRILGSLIRNPEEIEMFIDTKMSSEEAIRFYIQSMGALGWKTLDVYHPNRGGLLPAGSRNRGGNETFYKGLRDPSLIVDGLGLASAWEDEINRNRSGPVLTVNAYPGKGNLTDLRLHLNMQGPFPPGPPRHMRIHQSRNIAISLPALEAPEDSNMRGGGSGSSLNGAHSEITLETNLDLSTLVAHYKTQLAQSGCALIDEGLSGQIAWLNWTLMDDDRQGHGFLILLQELDQEYYLHLRMKSLNKGR